MSLVKTQVSKTREAASGPLTPLVILPPKARACTPKRSQEEGNGNATARKRIEKAAGSSGYDLHGTPPGRGAGSPYCDPPMVQRPLSGEWAASIFWFCTVASPLAPLDCFPREDSVKREERRKEERRDENTQEQSLEETKRRERNLFPGKGPGLQEKAFQRFL